MKKAISAATSAALLASLLATAVAPSAFAAVTTGITGIGNIPAGGTSGAVTVSLHEQSVGAIATTGSLYVDLTNATWTGTPVFSVAAGSLGASVSIAGSRMTIKITGYQLTATEDIVVTGVKVTAIAAGDITATLDDNLVGATYPNRHGDLLAAFVATDVTATGKLAQAYGIGTDDFAVALDTGSPCPFIGTNTVKVGSESVTPDASPTADSPVIGQYEFFATGDPFTVNHLANEVVTQSVPNCDIGTFPYPLGVVGTAAETLSFATEPRVPVYAGETNQFAAHLLFSEPSDGFLVAGTTITLTLATAGVTWSAAPTVRVSDGDILFVGQVANHVLPTLSADHKTLTFTVDTASTLASDFSVSANYYDVAASVPAGTSITVNAALSGGLFVDPTSVSNAYVFRGVAASATPTTVFIGQNSQKTGAITITEAAAGFFTAAPTNGGAVDGQNMFAVCLNEDSWSEFDSGTPPYAKVAIGAGNLVLRDGDAASTTGLVAGTPVWYAWEGVYCYEWTVWTASTTASTITIGSQTMASGALINVFAGAPAGPVNASIAIGNDSIDWTVLVDPAAQVTIANRVFPNQVVVTALSQPTIAPGSANAPAGDIQIAETATGQLQVGEYVCVEVLPRVYAQDSYLTGLNTANLPTATASGGLIIGPITFKNGENCAGMSVQPNLSSSGTHIASFAFYVTQQSTTGTGKIVIGNMHYIVPADAATGNVLVNVFGYGDYPTVVDFQSTVSNAKIGVAPKLSIGAVSALGLNPTSGYTTKTPKTQAKGKYVTWKFTGGTALAGQRVNVLVAKKINGAWGGPKYLKSAWADANGIVTFAWTSKTAAAVNVRVQWPGTNSYSVSISKALGAYWK